MNADFKKLFTDKFVLFSCIGALALIVFHGLFLLLYFQKLPPLIPLFNQMPWGQARFASKTEIFLPLGISVSFLLVNTIISSVLCLMLPLATRLLCATSFLIALFAFIVIIRTVFIII